MIISRTPFRVSFFGGGTDYPQWANEHGGSVLATTIDKYCYLSCRHTPPFFGGRFRAVYSRIESARTIDEISHPAIREVLRFLRIGRGVEVHYDGDLPARSGMGSSSAFTVGLLYAVHALSGVSPTKRRLAQDAITVEQDRIGEIVGSQDQVMAAYGGLNHVLFHRGGGFSVRPVALAPERSAELGARLMLFHTGIRRTASDVARTYVDDLAGKRRELRAMRDLVDAGIEVVSHSGDLDEFGKLLHAAWRTKKGLGVGITTPEVDAIYETARRAGALGGKLTGAGGGGFMLLFVPPERQARVREALRGLIHVPFGLDRAGTRIVLADHGHHDGEGEPRHAAVLRPFRDPARAAPRVRVAAKGLGDAGTGASPAARREP